MLVQELMEFNAREYAGAEALRMGEQALSYAELNQRANQLANGLLSQGLNAGDRVAVLSNNSVEFVLLFFACAKAGLVFLPLNYRLAPAELKYIVEASGARLLFAGDELLRANLDKANITESAPLKFWQGSATGDWSSLDTLFSDNDSTPEIERNPQNTVFQMYTSGTTGLPKGVMVNHAAVVSGILACLAIPPRRQVGDVALMPLPLFHVAGLAATVGWLSSGMKVELFDDFNPVQLVETIDKQSHCDIVLVPAMIQAILAFVPDVDKYDYSGLKRITYGASPISAEVLRKALALFDCDFTQGFGLTEVSCMVLSLMPEDHRRALNGEEQLLRSCGRPLPGIELKAADAQGNALPAGETGELWLRTPTLMQGYHNQPDKTAEAIVNGWFRTGDAGYVDEQGYFYIRDRVKDMVVSGGENIYPAEIENVLFSHPGIQDVAVIGVPDDRFGEAVMAVCVAAPEAKPADEEIIEFCTDKLARYKIPRQFSFIDELPRNPSGKVLKRVLREPYWQAVDRAVG